VIVHHVEAKQVAEELRHRPVAPHRDLLAGDRGDDRRRLVVLLLGLARRPHVIRGAEQGGQIQLLDVLDLAAAVEGGVGVRPPCRGQRRQRQEQYAGG
jgi:hypothetical protein